MVLAASDLDSLRLAKGLLERPGVAIRLTATLGYPIERAIKVLPEHWAHPLQRATREALMQCLKLAISSLADNKGEPPSPYLHKLSVALAGAASGIVGLPALLLELPISTTIMLRAIADIARSEGEDLHCLSARIACLEVFAFGSRSSSDDASDTGYLAVRTVLARGVSEAAKYIAERGLVEEGAPVLVRLVGNIASRFQVAVTEKMVAQAIPLVGAISGALVNTVFIDHFQDMARGHFIIRRLERTYGTSTVQSLYRELPLQAG